MNITSNTQQQQQQQQPNNGMAEVLSWDIMTTQLDGWIARKRKKHRLGDEDDDDEDYETGENQDTRKLASKVNDDKGALLLKPPPPIVLVISPGVLGLTLKIVPEFLDGVGGGARIMTVEESCTFRSRVSPGDIIVTIDGKKVQTMANVTAGQERVRELGIIRKTVPTPTNAVNGSASSTSTAQTFVLNVEPGLLGLRLTKNVADRAGGLRITGIDPSCKFRRQVLVGDIIAVIDGKRVQALEEIFLGMNRMRKFGIVRNVATNTTAAVKTEGDYSIPSTAGSASHSKASA